MRTIGLLNTAIRSFNQGDYIIVDSVKREMAFLLNSSFVVELPTHAPVFRASEFGLRPQGNSDYRGLTGLEFSLLCGTNLIAGRITNKWNQWNVQKQDAAIVRNVIAVGVGSAPGFEEPGKRAKNLYRRIFSDKYVHSARDERTANVLRSCGLRAINTGCATMWSLTGEHCAKIPSMKADTVVTTITDYKRDREADAALLRLLMRKYHEVYLWLQGVNDWDYLSSLGFSDKLTTIAPNLASFDAFLRSTECDYVGTRLHAGIRAMQVGRRSIILGVDNRSFDISNTFNINCIPRGDTDSIARKIDSSFLTDVGVDEDAIASFKDQFKG